MKLTIMQYLQLLRKQEDILNNKKNYEGIEQSRAISVSDSSGDYLDGATDHQKILANTSEEIVNYMIKTCEIIGLVNTDFLQIGSTVNISINCEGRVANKTVQIVEQMIPGGTGFLSVNSPLGKALLNRREGETFTFIQLNTQAVEVTICKIIKYQKTR